MPESVTAAASAAAANDASLDADLQALQQSLQEPTTPTAQQPAAAAAAPPATAAPSSPSTVAPQPGAAPSPEPADELTAKLEAIEEPKPDAEPPKPQLSDEQQRILAVIPNAQTAQTITDLATSYQNFTREFESGNFAGVEQMFKDWNPQAYEAFLEHVYNQKVHTSHEWVDRWIADQDGNPTTNRTLTTLQQQVAQLQQQLQQRHQQEFQVQSQAQTQQVVNAYLNHIDGLFNQIDFSKNDRKWVLNDIHNRVAANPQVRAAIGAGNTGAVNGIFKAAVREYVQRDKALAEGAEAQQQLQDKKKPLLVSQSPVNQPVNSLPDDVREVPKGQEENWLDQQLGKLAQSIQRKR